MKTFIINFKETPFAKIEDINFSKTKYIPLFKKISTFFEDLKEFKKQNVDSKILINNPEGDPYISLDFSFDFNDYYLKLGNIYYQETNEYSIIIKRGELSFGILMFDKEKNSVYLMNSENSDSFKISLFEKKTTHSSFIATFSNANKTHSLVEIPVIQCTTEKKISNTVHFDQKSLAEFISGTTKDGIESFYIKFNHNKCQMKDIIIVDGKIDTINKSGYVYSELPDYLKNKLACRNKCTLEEMYELTPYLKPRQEFNYLISDSCEFEFLEMDVLLEKIQNIIEENKNKIYFTSDSLVQNFKKIMSQATTQEKPERETIEHKSICFYGYTDSNKDNIDYSNINLNNIKNIYETLKQDFNDIQNLRSNTLKDKRLKNN